MSHYVPVNSGINLKYFPDNEAYHFRATFQAPLVLKGNWMVAILDSFANKWNEGYNNMNKCDDQFNVLWKYLISKTCLAKLMVR